MIPLTKLNGTPMMLNSDLVKTAEASPDTMLTLINGEKLIVREPIEAIVEAIVAYRARLLSAVANRVPEIGNLARASSLTSLDLANRTGEMAQGSARPSNRTVG